MNMPRNYEEAKVIIRSSNYSDLNERFLMKYKLKASFIAALGVITGVSADLITGSSVYAGTIIPSSLMISSLSLLPYFKRNIDMKAIENGEFFKKHSREEIMEMAERYVKDYNKFEKKKKGKSL